MPRDIEMEVKFTGDWDYEIRFETAIAPKVWINTGCGNGSQSIGFDDLDRIIAEYERFKKLYADANREQAA